MCPYPSSSACIVFSERHASTSYGYNPREFCSPSTRRTGSGIHILQLPWQGVLNVISRFSDPAAKTKPDWGINFKSSFFEFDSTPQSVTVFVYAHGLAKMWEMKKAGDVGGAG